MNPEQLLQHFDRISEAPDAIPKLRRFILDLAVRGKLVEQDPNDEPAAELLKRIEFEKKRCVKKTKELPSVPEEEASFELPPNWKWVRIRQITTDRGQTVPKDDFTYIDVTAINKESGRIGEPAILSAVDAPSRARKIIQKDDVIYSCVRPYLLNIAIVDAEIVPTPIASTAFAVLNGFGLTLPRYLWITLRSPFMIESVEERMRGQAYPAINDADFALLPIPLPPLAEQHRIVAKVDELMALCDQLQLAQTEREQSRDRLVAASLHSLNPPADDEAANTPEAQREHASFIFNHLPRLTTRPAHIKQLRQTILNLAVRGKLVPQDPNDEPAIELLKRVTQQKTKLIQEKILKPEKEIQQRVSNKVAISTSNGWEITHLKDVCLSITDGDHLPPPKAEKGIPFLVIGNVRNQSLEFAGCRYVPDSYYQNLDAIRRPSKGDLLYTLVGSYGIPVIVKDERPFCVQRHIGILRPSKDCNLSFLSLLMASSLVFQQATECATGIAQKTVPLSGLRAIRIPIPPLAEQHRIVAKVDELMALCDQLETQLTSTANDSRRLLEAVLHEALLPADVAA